MIEIKYINSDGVGHLTIEGHAGYNPGNDVVCAATSAIFQTALLGFASLASAYPDWIKITDMTRKEESVHDDR